MRPVFFRIWGALIGRTRRKRHIFRTSQTNNHIFDIDTLFLVPIQYLGHIDAHDFGWKTLRWL